MDLQSRLQSVLHADYDIERELGGGGMSRVFLATERRLGRRVVIKVLSSEIAATLSTERFAREIQLAASLQQANIVPVLTTGTADDTPYFTMPFVEGESLRARLSRGALTEAETISVLRDVARALVYAHERGVVHRDIKPDNILLSGESAVVTDFGIAKAIKASLAGADEAPSETITQLGTSLGTPAYIAPEQAAGDPATDHRADLYALGCVAFELLAGRPPFHGRAVHELLRAHMTETPVAISTLRPGVTPALSALIAQCLVKEPNDRPANAREVLRALDAAASGGFTNTTSTAVASTLSLPKALAAWAASAGGAYVLARAAVVGIGVPSWTVPVVSVVAALGLPAVLITWLVQRSAQRAAQTTPIRTPGGTRVHYTMATMALRASPHVSWKRTSRAGLVAAAAVVLAIAGVLVLRQFGIGPSASLLAAGRIRADSRIMVAEFAATTSDSTLGIVLAQAMRTALAQSSAVQLVSATDIAGALRRMTLPVTTRLTDSTAREVAVRNGIPLVITGQVTTVGAGFLITANIVAADSGTVIATVQEGAKGAVDMLGAIDQVAREVRSRLGESLRTLARAPSLESATTSSLAALREYTLGVQAGDVQGDFDAGLGHLRKAVALDSTFAAAWRKTATYIFNMGGRRSEQFNAAAMAYRYRERLSGSERSEVEAYYLRSVDSRRGEAAYRADSTLSRNNFAVILRENGRFAESEAELWKQLAKDSAAGKPSILQLWTNVVLAQIGQGKVREARQTLSEMDRRFGGSFYAEWVRSVVSWRDGGVDSLPAAGERLLRSKQLSSRAEGARQLAAAAGAKGLLRGFAQRAEVARIVGDSATGNGDPVATRLWTLVTQAVHTRQEMGGVSRIDSLLRAAPQGALPAIDSRALELAAAYAQLGRPDKAKPLIASWAQTASREAKLVRWADWHRASGEVALVEGRAADALSEFRNAAQGDSGVLEPVTTGRTAVRYARAFDKAGNADSATVWYERVVNERNLSSFQEAPLALPVAYRRLGELYEARGDAAKALERYRAFVQLWKDADPELQPQVAEVRARIARLVAADARKR